MCFVQVIFFGIQADPRFQKMEGESHSSHSGNNLDILPLALQIAWWRDRWNMWICWNSLWKIIGKQCVCCDRHVMWNRGTTKNWGNPAANGIFWIWAALGLNIFTKEPKNQLRTNNLHPKKPAEYTHFGEIKLLMHIFCCNFLKFPR